MVQLQLLFFETDLLGLLREMRDFSLNVLSVGGREENVLHFLRQFGDVLRVELLQLRKVFLLTKEDVCLVKNYAFESRQVQLPTTFLKIVV